MIYNIFKVDDHKLKIEDIERMDLKYMRGTCGPKERTLGTKTYLTIVADYIDIFLSCSLTL